MRVIRSIEGDTADLIARREMGSEGEGATERLLAANPGLAETGPVLPRGTLVQVPERPAAPAIAPQIRLWD